MKNRECRRKSYVLPLFLSLLAAIFVLGACTTPEKAKANHVARGQALLKDKKFQEAALEFRSALQITTSSPNALGTGERFEGLQRYQNLLRDARDGSSIRTPRCPREARELLPVGAKHSPRAWRAERLAKEFLDKIYHIEGHILMGGVLFAQDKKQEAFAELNRAIELNPAGRIVLSSRRFHVLTNACDCRNDLSARDFRHGRRDAHYEYGKFLVGAQRIDEAEAAFQKAIQVEPSNRDARFIIASFYLVNKRLDKAEEAYKALAEIDKDKPEGRSVLGDFYSSVGRLDEAIAIYKEVLTKSPDYTQAHYRLAEIMLNRRDIAGAKNEVESVLKNDATDRQALILRARIQMQAGQPNDLKVAIEDLREVLRQEPNSRAGLFFMAEANFRLGQMDQARVFAGDLERNYPEYLPAKLMQVQINLASGDAKSALKLAAQLQERLAKAAPDRDTSPQMLAELRVKALIAHGSAALQLRDIKTARQDFTAARDAAPHSPDSHVNLAAVALAEGKVDEAIGFYNSALSLDSAHFSSLRGLMNIYTAQRKPDQAHARIDQAIASQPNNASLHFLKGRVYGYEMNAQGRRSLVPPRPGDRRQLSRCLLGARRTVREYEPAATRYRRVSKDCRASS